MLLRIPDKANISTSRYSGRCCSSWLSPFSPIFVHSPFLLFSSSNDGTARIPVYRQAKHLAGRRAHLASAVMTLSFSALGVTLPIVALLILSSTTIQRCTASVTVYYQIGQTPLATASSTASTANYTGPTAYSPVVLNAPSPPGAAAFPTNFAMQLSSPVPNNASIPQNGSFFGFSIEMSVVNQVCKCTHICVAVALGLTFSLNC
jgi:hypothetical protein